MPPRLSATLLAAATLLGSCASVGDTRPNIVAGTALLSAGGQTIGDATLAPRGGGLELHIAAAGLPAGPHGLHLHAVGRCGPPDFASAGPHLNPHARMHGTENPQGSHLGDLPNLVVGANGKGSLTVPLTGARDELEALLFDSDGTALVIHAGPDDYRTDPSGNSGGRIACGVFTRS